MAATRHIILLTLVLLALLSFACARRGGGFRGGSSYRASSYRSSSYRSGTYRSSSSTYRSTYTSRRSGSYYSSSYIRYTPAVRYTRAYTYSYNSFYFYYYNTYFYHSGTYIYLHRNRPSDDTRVCANYEANANGTAMGVFTCPNPWEPADFLYCCGEDYAEYCCREKPGLSGGAIAGIVIGVIAGVVLLILLVYCCCYKSSSGGGVTETRVVTSTTVSSTVPDVQYQPNAYPGQPAPYESSAYPKTQPPAYDNPNYNGDPYNKTQPPNYEQAGGGYEVPAYPPENGALPYPPAPQPGVNGTTPYPPYPTSMPQSNYPPAS